MFCENCGKQLPMSAAFCTGCGHKVHLEEKQQVSQPQPNQSYNGPVPPVVRPIPASPPITSNNKPLAPQRNGASPHPNGGFAAPNSPHPNTSLSNSDDAMSYGQFMIAFLLLSIPLVNIILLFKWSFFSAPSVTQQNFAKALLTFALIGFILSIFFSFVGTGIINSLL